MSSDDKKVDALKKAIREAVKGERETWVRVYALLEEASAACNDDSLLNEAFMEVMFRRVSA